MNDFFLHIQQAGKKIPLSFRAQRPAIAPQDEQGKSHRCLLASGDFGKVRVDEYRTGLGIYRIFCLSLHAEIIISFTCGSGTCDFNFCLSGLFRYKQENTKTEILANSLAKLHYSETAQRYAYCTGPSNGAEYRLFQLTVPLSRWPEQAAEGRMKTYFSTRTARTLPALVFPANPELWKWVSAAQTELLGKKPDHRQLQNLVSFLLLTALNLSDKQRFDGSKKSRWNPDAFSASSLAENIILSMGDNWTIQKLAGTAKFSQAKLKLMFKKNIGMSSTAFRIFVRLEKAKQMLLHSKLTVREVAVEVGYSNPAYFSRLFKGKTGYSPSGLRKQALIQKNSRQPPLE